MALVLITVSVFISGILHEDGVIDNDASIKRHAEVAVAFAKAGSLAEYNY